MGMKNMISATLTPRRMAQGAIVLLFSGIHFATFLAIGGFIAHQHEDPNPEAEAQLYKILNALELPIAGPIRSLSILPDIFVWGAWLINSLLWGLAAYLICFAVFAGLRWLWRTLVRPAATSD